METNNQNPETISQTGVPQTPVQVENVQYTVSVGKYDSKPALVFGIANISLATAMLMTASFLFDSTGRLLGFSNDDDSTTLQLSVSVAIPSAIVAYLAMKQLRKITTQTPALLEDIKFKARLRKSFIFFLVISVVCAIVTIFNTIGIVTGDTDKAVQNSFFSLYFGGGAILMTLWLYQYQLKTKR